MKAIKIKSGVDKGKEKKVKEWVAAEMVANKLAEYVTEVKKPVKAAAKRKDVKLKDKELKVEQEDK